MASNVPWAHALPAAASTAIESNNFIVPAGCDGLRRNFISLWHQYNGKLLLDQAVVFWHRSNGVEGDVLVAHHRYQEAGIGPGSEQAELGLERLARISGGPGHADLVAGPDLDGETGEGGEHLDDSEERRRVRHRQDLEGRKRRGGRDIADIGPSDGGGEVAGVLHEIMLALDGVPTEQQAVRRVESREGKVD